MCRGSCQKPINKTERNRFLRCPVPPKRYWTLFQLVAISAATAAATIASTATTTEVSFDHRLGFIDRQRTTAEFGTVELGDRLVGLFLAHHDKTEALGSAGVAISNNCNRLDRTKLLKCSSDIALRRLKRQISNK